MYPNLTVSQCMYESIYLTIRSYRMQRRAYGEACRRGGCALRLQKNLIRKMETRLMFVSTGITNVAFAANMTHSLKDLKGPTLVCIFECYATYEMA